MKTAEQVWKAFENIRRAQNRGKYAPHKPLLLLLALARVQKGLPREVGFSEIELKLKSLLSDFGPSSASSTRHYPFWHLSTDSNGGLWQISGPSELLSRSAGATPNLSELRNPIVKAGFSPEIYEALRSIPSLTESLAEHILNLYFQPTFHDDIALSLGLSLAPRIPLIAAEPTPEAYDSTTRKRRDPAFRERVLRAYEYRCCICGFDLRIGAISAGLEAGHIKWHNYGGPDIEPNGLSLCALHHKLFDLGVFTLEPSEHRVIFSQHAVAGNRSLEGELRHHGEKMIQPQESSQQPSQEFLNWNLDNIFKKPGRSIASS